MNKQDSKCTSRRGQVLTATVAMITQTSSESKRYSDTATRET